MPPGWFLFHWLFFSQNFRVCCFSMFFFRGFLDKSNIFWCLSFPSSFTGCSEQLPSLILKKLGNLLHPGKLTFWTNKNGGLVQMIIFLFNVRWSSGSKYYSNFARWRVCFVFGTRFWLLFGGKALQVELQSSRYFAAESTSKKGILFFNRHQGDVYLAFAAERKG